MTITALDSLFPYMAYGGSAAATCCLFLADSREDAAAHCSAIVITESHCISLRPNKGHGGWVYFTFKAVPSPLIQTALKRIGETMQQH